MLALKSTLAALLLTTTLQSALAADAMPKRTLDLAKSSINQFILTLSDLQGAFPTTATPDDVAVAKEACLSAGTATVGFALLRTFNYTDAEILPLLADTEVPVKKLEGLALERARSCGLLF